MESDNDNHRGVSSLIRLLHYLTNNQLNMEDDLSIEDLHRFIRQNPHAAFQMLGRDEEELEYDEDIPRKQYIWSTGSRSWFPEVKAPQKAGVDLLMSGDFGPIADKVKPTQGVRNLARQISSEPYQPRPLKRGRFSSLIPNTNGTTVATYNANIYTAQFSADSSFYYTCAQDFRLHIYDMTSPPSPRPANNGAASRGDTDLQTTMKIRRSIQGHAGRWTITDANLSPDNDRLIYASIAPTVYLTNIHEDTDRQVPISFNDPPSRRTRSIWESDDDWFGIWSCRFSADGNEIIAGGHKYIFVYDLLANQRTVKISAHDNDVNSCCWADTASGNILVSASDDAFLKVWYDMDYMHGKLFQKPSGVLVGHTEGITYVSAKGDGRYVISNGKDQALRLWDLRKMRTSAEFDQFGSIDYGIPRFDYRTDQYRRPRKAAHPMDCSVMTYRGHVVLRTLIRCHFSPMKTTGGQYLYSGSADGKIHVWSLDGRIVQVLNRSNTLPMSFDPSEPEYGGRVARSVLVRDVSWHSQEPVLMSASWDSFNRDFSSVARHEWKGLSKLRYSLEDWQDKQDQELADILPRRSARLREVQHRRRQRIPGTFESDEED